MAELIKTPDRWQAKPEIEFPIVDMDDNVIEATNTVISAVVDLKGLKWVSGAGHGSFSGLSERVTELFTPTIPTCGEDCQMHTEVEVGQGTAIDGTLSFECPSISAPDEATVSTGEARCYRNYAAANQAFCDFVCGRAIKLEEAGTAVETAKRNLSERTTELNGLV